MTIKYFEEIDINKLEDYYSKEIKVGANNINVDLNFETKTLDDKQVQKLNSCISNIKDIINNSWQWILYDYKNGDDVKEYISFHLDDFFVDNPEEILEGTDPSIDNKDRFLQTLKVKRIGIYPSFDNYLVIDWMTNPDLSNYILVVNINENFELQYITIES
jgi:hypothetical protein